MVLLERRPAQRQFARERPAGYGGGQDGAPRRPRWRGVNEPRRSDLAGGERLLQAAWRRLPNGARIIGRDGDAYTVIYPGRPADGPGPDFRDALLVGPDGRVLRGDVEIHIRAAGWRSHGHHLDPRYNGVAFHVTAEPPPATGVASGAVTASGRSLHLLALRPGPPSSGRASKPGPGVALPEIDLAAAGDQRFFARSSGLAITIRELGADAAAWASVLDCLGFARNRRGFRLLAARLPWPELRAAMGSGADPAEVLLWAGGFGRRPDGLNGLRPAGPVPAWVSGGRPDNRPERRILAAAALARRWRDAGPLSSIVAGVREADGPRAFTALFRAGPDGPAARALAGAGRAGEIAINAALPLAHAWALMGDRWDVAEKALRLYREHPRLPDNAVTREMAALLDRQGPPVSTSARGEIKGAREQQGLMLVYRSMTAGPKFYRPSAGAPGE